MSTTNKEKNTNGDDFVVLYNFLFRTGPVKVNYHIVGMKTLAHYIVAKGLNQNSKYLSDDGTVSYKKLMSGLGSGFHMRNLGATEYKPLQISVNDLRDFLNSLHNRSLLMDMKYLRDIFQKILVEEELIEERHENLQKCHMSQTAIQHDVSCFRGTDERPASTIVIAVCMHGVDDPNRKYEPSLVAVPALPNGDIPQQQYIQLHHYTSVPCGYPDTTSTKLSNNIETMEAVLQLRSETQPKIDYVSTKIAEYAERNAALYHSGQKLYYKERYKGLEQKDFFACGLPVYDRLFEVNPLERNKPYGARILSWYGNEKIDPILDGLAIPNYLDPDVSSVHLIDNAHVILKDWQQKKGLPRMGFDITKSLEQNFKDNGMSDSEYRNYEKDYANRFNPLFDLDNSDFNGFYHEPSPHPIREELVKITTLDSKGKYDFTLRDVTNFAGGLGYKNVIVIDTGCRCESDFSNHEKAVKDYDQTPFSKKQGENRQKFGGEHKKKSKRKRKYLVKITSKTHKGRRLKNKSKKHKNKKATRR